MTKILTAQLRRFHRFKFLSGIISMKLGYLIWELNWDYMNSTSCNRFWNLKPVANGFICLLFTLCEPTDIDPLEQWRFYLTHLLFPNFNPSNYTYQRHFKRMITGISSNKLPPLEYVSQIMNSRLREEFIYNYHIAYNLDCRNLWGWFSMIEWRYFYMVLRIKLKELLISSFVIFTMCQLQLSWWTSISLPTPTHKCLDIPLHHLFLVTPTWWVDP